MPNNFTYLEGNLVKDPEQRGGDKGPVIVRIGVENRRKNKESGEWDIFHDNFDVTIWGDRRADALTFKEGDFVAINGRLKRDSYEKEKGKPETKVYQTVVNVEGITGKSRNGQANEEETQNWKF